MDWHFNFSTTFSRQNRNIDFLFSVISKFWGYVVENWTTHTNFKNSLFFSRQNSLIFFNFNIEIDFPLPDKRPPTSSVTTQVWKCHDMLGLLAVTNVVDPNCMLLKAITSLHIHTIIKAYESYVLWFFDIEEMHTRIEIVII